MNNNVEGPQKARIKLELSLDKTVLNLFIDNSIPQREAIGDLFQATITCAMKAGYIDGKETTLRELLEKIYDPQKLEEERAAKEIESTGFSLNPGDVIQVKGRNADLRTPEGNEFPYVIRNEDILFVREVRSDGVVSELREDVINRKEGREFQHGLFVVPFSYLDSKENIENVRKLVADFDSKYL